MGHPITMEIPTTPKKFGRTAYGALLLMVALLLSTFVIGLGARVLGLPDVRIRVGVSLTFFAFVFITLVAYDNLSNRFGKTSQKKTNQMVVIAIVVILALSALGYGARMRQAGEDVLDEFGDISDEILSGGFGADNEMGLAVTFVYEDTTIREYDPTTVSLSAVGVPLTITDDVGKVVKEVRCRVRVKVDWTGDYQSARVTGSFKLYVNDVAKNTKSWTYTNDISKNSYTQVANIVYTNTGLEAWMKSGENTLHVGSAPTVKITFKDGTSDSKSGSGAIQFTLNKGTVGGGGAISGPVYVTVSRELLR